MRNFVGRRKCRGQSTVEYVLLLAMAALFSVKIIGFFNDVFKEGLTVLEGNVEVEARTGQGFK
ncbi:MAG: hypothetical protein EBQ85_07325 [Proteobacteria bacterium]|nr:hypothetical protein [Pseudomonadota bacterium]